MKKKITHRIITLFMVFIMLLGLISSTALTAAAEEDTPPPPPGVMINVDSEVYRNLNNAKNGLKAMAAMAKYPGTAAIFDGVFKAVFGDENDQIKAAIAVLNEKLDGIKQQISDMVEYISKKIDKSVLINAINEQINNYVILRPDYQEWYNHYNTTLKNLEAPKEETEEAKEIRLNDIEDFFLYIVNNENTQFHKKVKTLGISILDKHPLTGVDLLTAFDKLILYSYNWEHQGYERRIAFQSYAIGLYTNLAGISMAGLIVGIEDADMRLKDMPEGTEKRRLKTNRNDMATLLDELRAQTEEIYNMVEAHTINIRPDDERYYQVPGHELLLKATAVPKTVNPTYPNKPSRWVMSYDLYGGVLCDGMEKNKFFSKYNENGYYPQPYDGKSAPYPRSDWLISVYKDYGGLKTMYEIFFDKNEGGIELPGIIGLDDPNLAFVTSDWWYYDVDISSIRYFNMRLIDKSGEIKNIDYLAGVYTDFDEKDGIKYWYPHMMIGLIVIPVLKAGPPDGESFEISGMEESYSIPYSNDIVLSMTENELYSYEWLVDKDGNGFIPINNAGTESISLGTVDGSMNGYQYRCRVIYHNPTGDVKTYMSNIVTLNLSDSDTPQTGDTASVLRALLLMIILGAFIVFLTAFRAVRKRRYTIVK